MKQFVYNEHIGVRVYPCMMQTMTMQLVKIKNIIVQDWENKSERNDA